MTITDRCPEGKKKVKPEMRWRIRVLATAFIRMTFDTPHE